MHFIWPIFSNLTKYQVFVFTNMRNIRKGQQAVATWDYRNVCVTTNGLLEMILRHFRYFHFSNINSTCQTFYEKTTLLRRVFKVLPKFHCLTNIFDLETLDGPLNIFRNFPARSFSVLSSICKLKKCGILNFFNLIHHWLQAHRIIKWDSGPIN